MIENIAGIKLLTLRAAALAAMGLALFVLGGVRGSPVAESLRRGDPVSGLLIGYSSTGRDALAEDFYFWRYRPRARRLDVLVLPAEAELAPPDGKPRRISRIFSAADLPDAASRARAATDAANTCLLSSAALSADHFLALNYEEIHKAVDAAGGLRFRLEEPVTDAEGNSLLSVETGAGAVKLTGTDVLTLLRMKSRRGDRTRLFRQGELAGAALRSPALWPRLPGLVRRGAATDMTGWDLAAALLEWRRIDREDVNVWVLPGRAKGVHWRMDSEKAAFVLQQLSAGAEAAVAVAGEEPSAAAGAADGGPSAEAPVVRVKVWNGSGRPGLALTVARRLRESGFDVVEWGNYNERQTRTRVVDRSGRFERARAVRKALGAGVVYSNADPSLRTDVEVILGRDFSDDVLAP